MLSKNDIEDVYSRMYLKPPKEIILLDGIIDVNGIAIGATKRFDYDRIIITPLSTKYTLVHELVHRRFRFLGERSVSLLSEVMYKLALKRDKVRHVKYEEENINNPEEVLKDLGLTLPIWEGKPKIKRYRLIESV